MSQAQLVANEAQISFEALDALQGLSQASRPEPPDNLSLCFVCMQWACSNPGCRDGSRCDLQGQLDHL
jgi:hypothetical protein